jgi:hypothetical protein
MVGHIKEKSQKERLLEVLNNSWVTQSEVSRKASLLYYRGKELLEILEKEGKVEKKLTKFYTYWRKNERSNLQ